MRPKQIILIRHGESIGNADSNTYHTTPDFALDPKKKLKQDDKILVGNKGHQKYTKFLQPPK